MPRMSFAQGTWELMGVRARSAAARHAARACLRALTARLLATAAANNVQTSEPERLAFHYRLVISLSYRIPPTSHRIRILARLNVRSTRWSPRQSRVQTLAARSLTLSTYTKLDFIPHMDGIVMARRFDPTEVCTAPSQRTRNWRPTTRSCLRASSIRAAVCRPSVQSARFRFQISTLYAERVGTLRQRWRW
eukprot:2530507-Pleurochrysis_carterae.AAC.3